MDETGNCLEGFLPTSVAQDVMPTLLDPDYFFLFAPQFLVYQIAMTVF
jgi:hypothetical protein